MPRTRITKSDIQVAAVDAGKALVATSGGDVVLSGVAQQVHTHTESQITDLSHDAVKIRTRAVSTAAPVSGQVLAWNSLEWTPSGMAAGGGSDTKDVKVSSDDTTAGYLEGKILAGANIGITVTSPGGDEKLQVTASGFSISGHIHDERYYTETELNAGQLDNRYYTEAEVTSISGGLSSALNTHKTSADHDGRYYTEAEVTLISGGLSSDLNTHKTSSDHDGRYFTEAEVTSISGGLSSALNTHTASGVIHFLEGSISHLNILNIGTNSHSTIDAHIASGSIHPSYLDNLIDVNTPAPSDGDALRWRSASSLWVASGVATGGGTDTKKVLVSSADTTEDYLVNKVRAGTNVTITTVSGGANEFLRVAAVASGATSDHGTLTGLLDDDHSQYPLMSGRASGQTIYGGTGVFEALTLESTSNANRGKIYFGSSSVYDDQYNKLGIGTTSPLYDIHVSGTGGHRYIKVQSADGGAHLLIDRGTETNWGSVQWFKNGVGKWALGNTDTNDYFHVYEYDVGPRITVTQGGKVGIGTDTPENRLHIYSGAGIFLQLDVNAAGVVDQIHFDRGAAGGTWFGPTVGNELHLWSSENIPIVLAQNSLEKLRITSTEVVVNDQSEDIDFRVESNGDANLIFAEGGTDRVGIGTGAPAYKLDVNGSVNVASGYNYYVGGVPIAAGTSSRTHSIKLPPGAWKPLDGTASNAAAALSSRVSTAGGNPKITWDEWLFDATTNEHISTSFVIPSGYTSSPYLKVYYKMASGISGNVNWGCYVACLSDGDSTDMDSDGVSSANTVSGAVPGTAGYLDVLNISLTSNDSMAAGDNCVLILYRDAAVDNAAGDAEMFNSEFTYVGT